MNVAFFLTPKSDVVWIPARATMRQALEKMEHHRWAAVPILDEEGRYVGTLTEGDLLWKMKATPGLDFTRTESVSLVDVPLRSRAESVEIHVEIEALFQRAIDQNFVPVVDGRGVLMGIVRRKAIIEYCTSKIAGPH